MDVLVTGANGFIGEALCRALLDTAVAVHGSVRSKERSYGVPPGVQAVITGPINGDTPWEEALQGIDVVVHLAAHVHVFQETSTDRSDAFRETNAVGTAHLARRMARQGGQRLIFLSSVGIYGKGRPSHPFTEKDPAQPQSPYARSKWEAEQALRQIAEETPLEVVVVRAPMVYGPSAPGNFARLARLITRGLPLPLASVDNRRSIISLDNLVAFLMLCVHHPRAAGETFLVHDGPNLSTSCLIRTMAEGLQQPARLLPCPPFLLRMGGHLLGRGREMESLLGSLTLDDSKARRMLGWIPPYRQQACIQKAVAQVRTKRGS